MMLFDLREPINALSHGAGMMLALPLTWVFWQRCVEQVSTAASRDGRDDGRATAYQRGKITALLIYGLRLVICFGNSALYHAVWLCGEPLSRFRRLDHVGIYLLIAGTYTQASWSLFRRSWRRGTLATVWSVADFCSARIWFGGVVPTWMSTSIYLAMGSDLWPQLFSDVSCIALWISSEKILTRLYAVLHWFHKQLEVNIKNSRENETVASFLEFFRPRTGLMQGLRGLCAIGRLLIPLHVQGDTLANVFSRPH